jgi:dGTPase
MRLNEDLTEAIGLGHDLGHPPFGHAGESALDGALRERFDGSFRHNEHSLRVVDVLERGGRGLNLTHEVRDGILNHTGPMAPASLEGRIVKLVDRVAYINHDIDDALRAGVLDARELPDGPVALLGATGSSRIDAIVHDLVETSERAGDIRQSEPVAEAMLALRTFLFARVYGQGPLRTEAERAGFVVRTLFAHFCEHPGDMGDDEPGLDVPTRVTDHIAGMTDRYALRRFEELLLPHAQAGP